MIVAFVVPNCRKLFKFRFGMHSLSKCALNWTSFAYAVHHAWTAFSYDFYALQLHFYYYVNHFLSWFIISIRITAILKAKIFGNWCLTITCRFWATMGCTLLIPWQWLQLGLQCKFGKFRQEYCWWQNSFSVKHLFSNPNYLTATERFRNCQIRKLLQEFELVLLMISSLWIQQQRRWKTRSWICC